MTIRNKNDRTFSPTTFSDAIDGTNLAPGMCMALTNLIPAPSTKNLWVCRPAQTELTDFTGFTTPGFISCMKVIGNRVYGLIATGRNVGKDEPFSYDISTGAFNTVSNVSLANVPTSPATSGAWTPPTMDLVGVNLVVTHPGFDGITTFIGWFNISNPVAPVWNAGNLSTSGSGTALTVVARAVAQFNGRAFVAAGSAVYATDPLTLNMSDASHILTFGDNIAITALKGLSLQSQLGGIVQSLIVFKGLANAFQIKGDFTTNDLTRDALNYAVGTLCPSSICDTPYGVGVICPDGLRLIDFNGAFSDPIGIAGEGANVPFINALVPSRVSASCNASVLRVSVQNGGKSSLPEEEYWFHIARKCWSGPHTFAPSLSQPFMTKFITAPLDVPGALYISETVPTTTSVYTENGSQLQWNMAPVFLPDDGKMGVYSLNEMTVKLAIDPSMISWTARILNADNAQYDEVINLIPATTPVWDVAIWDSDVWDGIASGLSPRRINWHEPIVTSRFLVSIIGGSAGGVAVGDFKYSVQETPYVPNDGF